MRNIRIHSSLSLVSFTFLFLLSCKVQLAPSYDELLIKDINETYKNTYIFFASLEDSITLKSYESRLAIYSKLIGQYNALHIRSQARPVPNKKAEVKVYNVLANKFDHDTIFNEVDDVYPSAHAFKAISKSLTELRNQDSNSGIHLDVLTLLKNEIDIYMDQAITYENHLKR